MQHNGQNQRYLVILTVLTIIGLVLALSINLTYAQKIISIHQKNLYEIIDHTHPNQHPSITVGKSPSSVALMEKQIPYMLPTPKTTPFR
jgi:hypothetical protein